ncbi:hypothetical protein GEOBRER4_n1995 [Citrifermentans bremense]|uniref:Uncharacterized protein n=1 Tax=Citrifermentans bremense TaxID=60035 RepID=A0A6S6M0P9_9BACT|nr:gamma-mobile-trio protein GmtX [Citrifermentans bremense]BCG47168.1 hypothetical protein GEOBRER4_n1995 [Citrifermentans bremense]
MTKVIPTTTAPDVVKDARQLYRLYRDAANRPSKVDNLDRLWEVLDSIRNEGGRDYSIAEIGRRLESIGGPKTQSMRNAQGAYFREIITAYANAVNGSTRYIAASKSRVEQALDLVSDPSVRATLRMAIEEGRRLKIVNDNLHAAFKNLHVGVSLSTTSEEAGIKQNSPGQQLPQRFRAALAKGIDETRLAQQGLVVEADGSICNEVGDRLFPPSFVTAILAVLIPGIPGGGC